MKFRPSNITEFSGEHLLQYHGQVSILDIEYCATEFFLDNRMELDHYALVLEHLRQIALLFDQVKMER